MKFLKMSIIALLIPALFLSCKKDGDAVLPLEGNWIGLYGNDNELPSITYNLNIKHGGVIDELNSSGLAKGIGNWSLIGNQFTAHYQWKAPLNTVFTLKANYNSATKKLTGTWGFDNSATDGGKWEAIKSK